MLFSLLRFSSFLLLFLIPLLCPLLQPSSSFSSFFYSTQAAHLAYPGGVDDTAVYLCTGEPLPGDVRAALAQLLNAPFDECFTAVHTTCHTSG